MDKRSLVAMLLIALVIVGGSMIGPHKPAPPIAADSSAVGAPSAAVPTDSSRPTAISAAATAAKVAPASQTKSAVSAIRAESVTVVNGGVNLQFVSPGAAPTRVTFPDYLDLNTKKGAVAIAPPSGPLMHFRIASGRDTIALDTVNFTTTRTPTTVEFVSSSPAVRVKYDLTASNYLTHAQLTYAGAAPGSRLLIDLAGDFGSAEADTTDDFRHLAYAYRRTVDRPQSYAMQKLDTTKTIAQQGPIDWISIRSKYFLVAVIARDTTARFSDVAMRGGHHPKSGHATGMATGALAMTPSGFAFDLYTGPQTWKTLSAVGYDLVNINPTGSILRPVVQPFATIVMRSLLGMKAALGLSYGWVIVIFAIGIRLLLWPLNQNAMRNSIKMQRLQPEMAVIQKKYAKDPQAQQEALKKVYADHGMSPLSPLLGCLPMLLPMPILFALFFVFRETIEFRGVSFLWLPDISLRDPLFITPIAVGASMLLLSWIGMRAAPQNAQAKIMGYMMPAVFMMMFVNLASGLNLYYAVQNLITIPQQWLLTRERVRNASGGTPVAVEKRR